MSFNVTSTTSTSYASLNIFERAWVSWFDYFQNDIFATALISFLMHEIVYFGRCVPFLIADYIPTLQKYKLQPNKVNTAAEQWKCTKAVLISHFCYELPLIAAFHPFATFFGMDIVVVPFPTWQKIAYQVAFFFVFEDTFHYWFHRLLHYGALYRNIHKLHHEYTAPFGLAAEYAHPVEVLILGMGTIGGPLLWVAATHDLHMITVMLWITLRLFQAIDAHSGYDFPWSLRHFIPFWAGAEHHDYHHMSFVNCYSTSFRWWDYMMGTDDRYKEYRKKREERRKVAAEKKDN